MNFDENTKNDNKKFVSISSFEYDARTLKKDKIKLILSIPQENRTIGQKTMLIYYCLNVSKLPQKFIKEHIDKASYINIIHLSQSTFTYKLIINNGNFVYEVNDIANYFYIILKGSAKIIKPEKYVKEMSPHQYYLLLMNYKKENQICLLEKTIKENYSIFPIDKNHIKYFEKIYLKILIIKQEEKYSEESVEDLVNKVGLKMSDFGLLTYEEELYKENQKINEQNNLLYCQKKLNQIKGLILYNYEKGKEYSRENRKKIRKMLDSISPDITIHYSFLTNDEKYQIIFFKFIDYKNISTNDYFGDFENNKYVHRVIPTSDELELLSMRNDIYSEFMKNQKTKIKLEQINFLLQNFFFSSINRIIFEKLYYDLFDFENYKNNEIILKENTPVDYLYFIKSGKVNLISNKSVVENHLMINLIYDILKKQNKNDKNITLNEKYMKLYSISYIDSFGNLSKEINLNKNNNLMIYKENQCIGHECFFYGFNYLYTAVAKSDQVELYKIGVDKLMKIIKDRNKEVYIKFVKKSFESLSLLFKLIININSNLANSYNNNKAEEDIFKKLENEEDSLSKDDFNDKSKNFNLENSNRNKNSELYNSSSINLKRNVPNNLMNDDKNYKALPILSKYHNFRNININKEEIVDKNNIEEKIKKSDTLSLFKIKNSSLNATNSYRSSNSSNNISNINQKYKMRNNYSTTNLLNNNCENKSKIIFENSILKKLKKKNLNSINLFNLRKNIFDNKNMNINIDNNSSTNIITFDFPIQQQYKYSNSVKNKNKNFKNIEFDKSNISKKNNKNYQEFNSYYKYYISFFDSYKDFKNFEYNNKHSMVSNKNKFKYSIIDGFRPKFRKKNHNLNFKLISNLEKKEKNNTIYKKFIDKNKLTNKPNIFTFINKPEKIIQSK